MKAINRYLDFYAQNPPITAVYGLTRSLLALATLLTFLFNPVSDLFINFNDIVNNPQISSSDFVRKMNIFIMAGASHLSLVKLACSFVLFLVLIGWRPRFTGILHWWISFSFSSVSTTIDGGDTIASILSFFLIPFCLADNRKWHWSAAQPSGKPPQENLNLFLWSVLFVARLQVCIIYLHAGIDKLRIEEWGNGTCTYYWFTNNLYGAADWLRPFLFYVMSKPVIVVALTWGTIIFEIMLAMSIFMDRKRFNWRLLLAAGILFHLGIVLVFGLISFFLTMTACLVLYLVPVTRFKRADEFKNIFPLRRVQLS